MPTRTSSALLTSTLALGLLLGSGATQSTQAKKKTKQPSYRLGKLKEGLSMVAVKKLLGKPTSIGKPQLQGATGEYLRTARFAGKGISIDFTSGKKTGPWTVGSITAKRPCKLETGKGIGIGSSRKAVERAYKKRDKRHTNAHQYVAGSIYGGMIFSFDKGKKVTSIFIGAAAE